MRIYSKPCAEMLRFQELLDAEGVKWRRNDNLSIGIFRTQGTMEAGCRRVRFSVVCGYGAYGAGDGLLELMVDYNEPTGYLTADETLSRIKQHLGEAG